MYVQSSVIIASCSYADEYVESRRHAQSLFSVTVWLCCSICTYIASYVHKAAKVLSSYLATYSYFT